MAARLAHAARATALGVGAALLVSAAPSALAAGGVFGAFRATPLTSPPDAVAVGDVTGDGLPDIVGTTWYANRPETDFHLVVLAGRSDGTQASPVWYATAGSYVNRLESVVIGDVTGDGRNDVVVGVKERGVQVFPGTAAGPLGSPTLTATPDGRLVRLGNLDGNPGLDAVAIGWGTDTATVLRNVGGSLVAQPSIAVTHDGWDDLEVADVTGDGRDDIVVMSGQGFVPNLQVLPQLAAGGFGAPVPHAVGGNQLTNGIGVGDVTGDGRVDVVASYGGNAPGAFLAVFAQATDGTLAAPVSVPSYDIPETLEVGDVDRDGRADAVVVHGGWNAAGVYLGTAGGTLAAEDRYALPYASHYGPFGLALGDVTADGSVDAIIADYNNGIVVLPGPSVPRAPGAPTLTSATPGDGRVTLAWTAPASNGGSGITDYTATAAPGGATCTTTGALTCAVTGLTNGTAYTFTVTARNATGTGAASNAVAATPVGVPSAPRTLKATAGKAQVSLSWTAPAATGGSPVTGYRIYRGTSSGTGTWIATVSASTLTFVDRSVARRTTAWYRVTATNAAGESAPSNEVSATPK